MEDQLTEQEREVLNLERLRWKYAGAKENAIRERFGWSSARYYQVLNALLDRPAAMAHDPVTVRRLSGLRALRRLRDRADAWTGDPGLRRKQDPVDRFTLRSRRDASLA